MSDNTLDELIAKVKSEAIDSAEKESHRIIEEAKQNAQQLLRNVEAEKDQLLNDAQSEADAILNKGKIALQQAARDVHISVKNDLLKVFRSVLETEVAASFTPELYTSVVKKIIDTLGGNTNITLPDKMEDQLIDAIRTKVAQPGKNIGISKDEQLFSGLSITKTDEGWSYDITAEEVSELISQNLNRKWVDILNEK
ncbi:MAG: hypothetical protein HKO94_08105 [Flavobacteriaceae bacterium]|nr:hypothetical protein [Flavobacteriaceae bacterium]